MYYSAAQSFLSVPSDIHGTYTDAVTGRDVALYGSICALASFNRKELKELVINNAEFKKILEQSAPTTWKIILQQFYNSNYAKVFEMMEQLKVSCNINILRRLGRTDNDGISCSFLTLALPFESSSFVLQPDLYLDLFLSSHVNRLMKQIRERAFIQYFK